jgi:peptide deformylase
MRANPLGKAIDDAMTVLTVYTFPHPVLRRKAQPVTAFAAELKTLADNMLDTMYAEGGIGLAAVQVGQLLQLVVTDLLNGSEEEGQPPKREPRVWVNPRILEAEGEIVTEEGCLSVGEFRAEVKRANRIRLAYQTLSGERKEQVLEEVAAVCLQHEIDHLNGKLFIDRLPPVRRELIKKRLIKLQRTA